MNHILITEENVKDFEDLLPPGFSPEENRVAIGAYDDEGYMAGAISIKRAEFECDVDWLYVTPSFRRKGVGTGLLEEAINMIDEIGVVPFTSRFEASRDDDGLVWFFRSFDSGKRVIDVSFYCNRYYLTEEDLINSFSTDKKRKLDNIFLFVKEPRLKQDKILARISEWYTVTDFDKWKKTLVPELSTVIYKDGELENLMLFNKRTDGNIELSFLYGDNPLKILPLIQLLLKIKEKYYKDAKLSFDTVTEEAAKMAAKMFRNLTPVAVYEAEG